MPPPPRIAHYSVVRELGAGGMGVVYEVVDPRLNRNLALKTLDGKAASETIMARFLREAEAMGRIVHPRMIKVHDVGQWQGGYYLTMELIAGETLYDAVARKGPLDPRRAAEVGVEIADGLIALHAAGSVHRDLKPQNVMLREDGSPVLLDFGLVSDVNAETLTRTGEVLGTPSFMAPEQGDGTRPRDPTVDVYGLAATLYHSLTGQAPFVGTPMQVLMGVLKEEPTPVRKLRPELPVALCAVIEKAMRKEAGERYPDMGALQADLRRFVRGEPPLAYAEAKGGLRSRFLFAGVGALLLCGVTALAVVLAQRPDASDHADGGAVGAVTDGTGVGTTASVGVPTEPEQPLLWDPEGGAVYEVQFLVDEQYARVHSTLDATLRATVLRRDDRTAELSFVFERVRWTYGSPGGMRRTHDTAAESPTERAERLRGVLEKPFGGVLGLRTGHVAVNGLEALGRDIEAQGDETGESMPGGDQTEAGIMNHIWKTYLSSGFFGKALSHLLHQGGGNPLPWIGARPGERPGKTFLNGRKVKAGFQGLLGHFDPHHEGDWDGEASYEQPDSFKGKSERRYNGRQDCIGRFELEIVRRP